MLGFINIQAPLSASRPYNILQVIAGFPLNINFDSSSVEVQVAISENNHPLAKLSNKAYSEGLGDSEAGRSIINQLLSLKKTRQRDDETLDDRPTARRKVA